MSKTTTELPLRQLTLQRWLQAGQLPLNFQTFFLTITITLMVILEQVFCIVAIIDIEEIHQ